MRKLLCSCALFLFSFGVSAQEMTVSGVVTDALTNNPVPGVNISIKGTNFGTTSGIDGRYQLNASTNDVIVFSFIGYETVERTVTGQTINIQLAEDATQLNEVVVIGYGTVDKEDATGSITTVGEESFNEGNMVSPQDLLVGRVAGVQVTTNGGAPGEGAQIRIRGGSSLNAKNDPLIVVDGLPLSNEGIDGLRNGLSSINPNDIESFTILKDASATAIYGSRASNGVILITTKKGAADKKLSLTYAGQIAVNTIREKVDVLSGDDYRTLVTDYFTQNDNDNDPSTPHPAIGLLGTSDTDWQDEIFETAIGLDHNLSAGGSIMDIPYRVSVGYSDQDGILKYSNFNRLSYTANLNPTFFDDHLQVNLSYKGSNTENDFSNAGAIGAAVTFDPTQSVFDPESPWGGYFYWEQPGNPGEPEAIAPSNPVALLDLTEDISKVQRHIANAQINYRFHFLPELQANLNLATDISSSEGTNAVSPAATWAYNPPFSPGSTTLYDQEMRNELLEFYLNYKRELPGIDSEFDLLGGYSYQHFERSGSSTRTTTDETHVYDSLDYGYENLLISFYTRLNYSLKDKYLLTLTLRRDGSSRFIGDNQWGLFPSAALAWKIDEESFLQNSETISELKLRLGYGVTGQEDVGNPYPALARVTIGEPTAGYFFGDELIRTIRYEGYDANLKWEETTTYNAGIDFGFFNNRITGTLDYYFRETEDLLNEVPIPMGTNFTNRILTNIGSLENQGIELSLNARVIEKNTFSWDAGMNVTRNKNKITGLTLVEDPNFIGVLTGGIGGGVGNTAQVHNIGYPANSFFMYEQVYDDSGMPIEGLYVDQDGNGIINDFDRVVSEDPAPDVYMGFSSDFRYGKLNLSFNAHMNIGNYVYDNVESQYSTLLNLYNPNNFLNNVASSVYNSNFYNPQYLSDFYLTDASFFRMDNITLGYDFGNIASDNVSLSANVTVQNAFVITKYEGLDPEVAGGIDNNIYPRPRVFILGVKANFNY